MPDANYILGRIAAAIDKYGRPGVIVKTYTSTHNSTTQQTTQVETSAPATKAFIRSATTSRDLDLGKLNYNTKVYIKATDLDATINPKDSAKVVIGSSTYDVAEVELHEVQGVGLLYEFRITM